MASSSRARIRGSAARFEAFCVLIVQHARSAEAPSARAFEHLARLAEATPRDLEAREALPRTLTRREGEAALYARALLVLMLRRADPAASLSDLLSEATRRAPAAFEGATTGTIQHYLDGAFYSRVFTDHAAALADRPPLGPRTVILKSGVMNYGTLICDGFVEAARRAFDGWTPVVETTAADRKNKRYHARPHRPGSVAHPLSWPQSRRGMRDLAG